MRDEAEASTRRLRLFMKSNSFMKNQPRINADSRGYENGKQTRNSFFRLDPRSSAKIRGEIPSEVAAK